MKRLLRRLAVALALLASFAAPPIVVSAAQAVAKQTPEQITVYVTRTGQKYHRDGCRYLSRSKIPMSLKEAAKRFTPCSVCRPPVVGNAS